MNLYEMKLGDDVYCQKTKRNIIRVPGGWIYESGDDSVVTAMCFVPFHNEFMECSGEADFPANVGGVAGSEAPPTSAMLQLLDILDELVSDIESDGTVSSFYYQQKLAEVRSAATA